MVIRSRPGKDNWNAIDPNLVEDENHNRWLSFGSFWGGIQLVALDPATGKPDGESGRPVTLAVRPDSPAIEAPFIIRRGPYYYLWLIP